MTRASTAVDPECDGGHAFLAMFENDEGDEAMPRPARTIAEIAEYGALIPDGAPDIPGRLPYDDGTVPAGVAVAADRAGVERDVSEQDPVPCRCHQSHAYVTPWHPGHCCFRNPNATCHEAEVAAWVAADRRGRV